ncbi:MULTISPECIES: hypothetical protein [unclassified Mesorhizobium]|uniref:hypothetical protein n=1 Tax=unclassified Mesorhizobium TaxID=325217 RepID=UPI001FDF6584|nr:MULTISPECIES: hypothetical protein [unclassified Mesorhizobium]
MLGVERKARKPAFALMADRATGRYVGSAFINSSRAMRNGRLRPGIPGEEIDEEIGTIYIFMMQGCASGALGTEFGNPRFFPRSC